MMSTAPVAALALFLLFSNPAYCLRFPKENTRPKLKCHRNVTLGIELQESGYYPRCIALNSPFCLDIRLPYNSTYLPDNLPDLNFRTFEDVNNYLQRWNGVRKLPKCWPVLQVALCSILMPQCDENFQQKDQMIRVHRPSLDICNDLVHKPECKFIDRQLDWPTIFNCNDTNLFAKNCTNDLRDLKYSGTSMQTTCQYPLVATNDESSWFRDIGGCALHCKFPLSSRTDQVNLSVFIRFMTLIGIFSTLTTMVLFHTNRARSKNSRLDKVIKRCNICQFLLYIGWSLQIIFNEDIACNPDGSQLFGQPLVASPCVLSFLLTYLPSLSSLFWCAYFGRLTYENLMGRNESNKPPTKTELDPILSLINYGMPVALFLCVAFLGHIDGHGLYGICTVGQQSIWVKVIFIFMPLVVGMIYGNYYFFKIIMKLAFVKKPLLRRVLMRISAQSALTTMQTVFTIGNYFYEKENRSRWHDSIEKFVNCNLNLPSDYLLGPTSEVTYRQPDCHIDTKPIVTVYYLELLSNLALGIVISSWLFKEKNFHGLKRTLIELLEDDEYRESRARNNEFINGKTNAKLANDEVAVVDDTFYDLVDITSGAKVNRPKLGNDVELEVDASESMKQLISRPHQQLRAPSRLPSETPMSRRPSLISTSLEIPAITTRHNRYNNNNNNNMDRTSRDVVEEMRMLPQASNQPLEQTQQQMDLGTLALMLVHYQHLTEANNKLISEQPGPPNFVHGLCQPMQPDMTNCE